MIELPETYVLAEQINQTLVGKTIMNVTANAHPTLLHGIPVTLIRITPS